MNLPILSTSYKWTQTPCVLPYVAYFTWHSLFKVHPCCGMLLELHLFKLNNIPLYVHISHILFIHLSASEYFSCFHLWLLWVMPLKTWVFKDLFGYIPKNWGPFGCIHRSGTARYVESSYAESSHGHSMFNVLRNHYSNDTIRYPHHQCILPHLHQHWLLFIFV